MVTNDVGQVPKRTSLIIPGDYNCDIFQRDEEDNLIGPTFPCKKECTSNSEFLTAFVIAFNLRASHTFGVSIAGYCEGWAGETFWGGGKFSSRSYFNFEPS